MKIERIFSEIKGMSFHIKKGQVIKIINEKKTPQILANHHEIPEYMGRKNSSHGRKWRQRMPKDFPAAIVESRLRGAFKILRKNDFHLGILYSAKL